MVIRLLTQNLPGGGSGNTANITDSLKHTLKSSASENHSSLEVLLRKRFLALQCRTKQLLSQQEKDAKAWELFEKIHRKMPIAAQAYSNSNAETFFQQEKDILNLFKQILEGNYSNEMKINAYVARGIFFLHEGNAKRAKSCINDSISSISRLLKGEPHSSIQFLGILREFYTQIYTRPFRWPWQTPKEPSIIKKKLLTEYIDELEIIKKKGEIRDSEYLREILEIYIKEIKQYKAKHYSTN